METLGSSLSIHGLINLGGNTLREKLHEPCACGIQIGALRSVNTRRAGNGADGEAGTVDTTSRADTQAREAAGVERGGESGEAAALRRREQ